jgi:hypothetical protein
MVRPAHCDHLARLSRLHRLHGRSASPDMSPWMACMDDMEDLHGRHGRPAWSSWMACMDDMEGLHGHLGWLAWTTWKTCMVVLEDQAIEVAWPANLSSQVSWCDMDRQTDWVGKPSHVDHLAMRPTPPSLPTWDGSRGGSIGLTIPTGLAGLQGRPRRPKATPAKSWRRRRDSNPWNPCEFGGFQIQTPRAQGVALSCTCRKARGS